ncbi:MAG: hypothetical protein AB8E15_04800 [Bdellovibrionales bacterium]
MKWIFNLLAISMTAFFTMAANAQHNPYPYGHGYSGGMNGCMAGLEAAKAIKSTDAYGDWKAAGDSLDNMSGEAESYCDSSDDARSELRRSIGKDGANKFKSIIDILAKAGSDPWNKDDEGVFTGNLGDGEDEDEEVGFTFDGYKCSDFISKSDSSRDKLVTACESEKGSKEAVINTMLKALGTTNLRPEVFWDGGFDQNFISTRSKIYAGNVINNLEIKFAKDTFVDPNKCTSLLVENGTIDSYEKFSCFKVNSGISKTVYDSDSVQQQRLIKSTVNQYQLSRQDLISSKQSAETDVANIFKKFNSDSKDVKEGFSCSKTLKEDFLKGKIIIPDNIADDFKTACPGDDTEPNFAALCSSYPESDEADEACSDIANDYFNNKWVCSSGKALVSKMEKKLKTAEKRANREYQRDNDTEGEICLECLEDLRYQKSQSPSKGEMLFGSALGLLGQYWGIRAYDKAIDRSANAAADLGLTYNPPNTAWAYAGAGLNAVAGLSGIATGSYVCQGAGAYGGQMGMNNPYMAQQHMMGQGGAFGYPWGAQMGSPHMGMYMPGQWGMNGPMGMQMPFHMQGQMSPFSMAMNNPYAAMMGPQAAFNPMAQLGPLGMMGMLGGQGSFNPNAMFSPYGAMGPYAMQSPFGSLSAHAGFGPFAGNPAAMFNGQFGGQFPGLMSCFQAPCPGQMFGGPQLGGQFGGQFGSPFGGVGGLGGGQFNTQYLQQQQQQMQQQLQQQQAYYQQLQQQAQQRQQATQQLANLQQQMSQLQSQASQLYGQAYGGSGGQFGGQFGTGLGGFGAGLGGNFNLNLGGSALWGQFPYQWGPGNFSPNMPTNSSGTPNLRGARN